MEKNVYSKLVLAIILMGSVLTFSACGSDDDDELKQLKEAEQLKYREFVSVELEKTLVNTLNVDLHRGINPPNVEGYFFFETHCVSSTITGDPVVGTRRNDLRINLHNQKGLDIDFLGYEMTIGTNTKYAEYVAAGTFITGEGDNFSIFFNEETSYVAEEYITTAMTVLTGQVDRDVDKTIVGIKNMQYVLMMIDNDGKPNTMPDGSGRLFEYEYAKAITKEDFERINKMQKSGVDAIRSMSVVDLK